MLETSCFHGGGFTPDIVLLGVKEQCGCPSIKEGLVRGIARGNAGRIVELYIPEPKLGGTSMGRCFGIFTGPKTEEKLNLDKIGRTLGLW